MPTDVSQSDFQTTSWTQVNEAARRGEAHNPSLESLCRRYWYPLYAFLRRSGYDANTAEDYVQGFFADVLSRGSLQLADPTRGKFRSFLITACKNFVSNQQRNSRTLRRGGGHKTLSIDVRAGENRYITEPVDQQDPQKLFDRRWAIETIEAALEELRVRYQQAGKEQRFLALRALIAPASRPPSHSELAIQLSMSEGAVKVAAHRLRQQFAAALRDQVAATVDLRVSTDSVENVGNSNDLVDAELSELLDALGN